MHGTGPVFSRLYLSNRRSSYWHSCRPSVHPKFQAISGHILETVIKIGPRLLLITNMKSDTLYQMRKKVIDPGWPSRSLTTSTVDYTSNTWASCIRTQKSAFSKRKYSILVFGQKGTLFQLNRWRFNRLRACFNRSVSSASHSGFWSSLQRRCSWRTASAK